MGGVLRIVPGYPGLRGAWQLFLQEMPEGDLGVDLIEGEARKGRFCTGGSWVASSPSMAILAVSSHWEGGAQHVPWGIPIWEAL